MAVTIGHACIDERGKAYGGAAGDQTKKEVYIRSWYSKPWHTVFRPKSSAIAEKIAKAMEQACKNDNIGYDQHQRTTLFIQAKAKNWDISKVTVKCETDCSALVAVCCNAAGITVSKDMYTGNEKTTLSGTGKFTVHTSNKYIGSSDYLKRGDILLGNGHTAIVLSDGNKSQTKPKQIIATGTAQSLSKPIAGTYITTATLNIRNKASANAPILVTVPKNTEVKNFGYYTNSGSTRWLYIQFNYNDTLYTGFASSKHLKKQG